MKNQRKCIKILQNRIENQSIKISWNGKTVLTEGMYFFVITTDKETITKKVIIE